MCVFTLGLIPQILGLTPYGSAPSIYAPKYFLYAYPRLAPKIFLKTLLWIEMRIWTFYRLGQSSLFRVSFESKLVPRSNLTWKQCQDLWVCCGALEPYEIVITLSFLECHVANRTVNWMSDIESPGVEHEYWWEWSNIESGWEL